MLLLIVSIEDPQVLSRRLGSPRAPNLERSIPLRRPTITQIKSVKDKRLALGIKHAPKCPSVLALAIDIEHIHHVQITGPHQVVYVASRCQQLSLALQHPRLRRQLLREFADLAPLRRDNRAIAGAR